MYKKGDSRLSYHIKGEHEGMKQRAKNMRLQGFKLNGLVTSDMYTIFNFTILNNPDLELTMDDLFLLSYLADLDTTFNVDDFDYFPNKIRWRRRDKLIKRYLDMGYMELQNRTKKREFILTTRVRRIIIDINKMLLRIKKIPIGNRFTCKEFTQKPEKITTNVVAPNWYLQAIKFNKKVDKILNNNK